MTGKRMSVCTVDWPRAYIGDIKVADGKPFIVEVYDQLKAKRKELEWWQHYIDSGIISSDSKWKLYPSLTDDSIEMGKYKKSRKKH